MSYCVIIRNKAMVEGDTIDCLIEGNVVNLAAEVAPENLSIQAEILKIDVESQSLKVIFEKLGSDTFDIPISIWNGASIIKKSEIDNPNILFKLNHACDSLE